MREIPILFKTEMVQAILTGHKSMTRRLSSNSQAKNIKVGDILWVKETFSPTHSGKILFRADKFLEEVKWKSSLFMRKSDSRLRLKVVEVKTHYLQSISCFDALCEGIQFDCGKYGVKKYTEIFHLGDSPLDSFRLLWDSINKKSGFGWETNPEVIAIKFEREN